VSLCKGEVRELNRINIGCGRTITEGWTNLDNSPSLKLARHRVRLALGKTLRLVSPEQIEYIEFCRSAEIGFADATKRIPAADGSVDAIYSSHMVEHLSRDGFTLFLDECKRALRRGGVLRLVVPDIDYHIKIYNTDGDADRFLDEMLITAPPIDSLRKRLAVLIAGYRHHQWMYNSRSMEAALLNAGFESVRVLPAGETQIDEHGSLDLYERAEESVFIEAICP